MIIDYLKIGAGVAVIAAIGFAGLHYKSLLADREKLHDAVQANQELNQTVVKQRTEIALINNLSKDIAAIKQGISAGKRERQNITDRLVEQNEDYKQWRNSMFPPIVNQRLRESANNINKVNSGRSTLPGNSSGTGAVKER